MYFPAHKLTRALTAPGLMQIMTVMAAIVTMMSDDDYDDDEGGRGVRLFPYECTNQNCPKGCRIANIDPFQAVNLRMVDLKIGVHLLRARETRSK